MKPTTGDGDRDFGQLIAGALGSAAARSGEDCPGADLLAAWTDRLLPSDEAAAITDHVASCARCQQVTAAIVQTEPEVMLSRPLAAERSHGSWLWHWRWAVPLATAAVVILIVGSRTMHAPSERPALIAQRSDQVAAVAPPAAVAENRAPESAALAPPQGERPATIEPTASKNVAATTSDKRGSGGGASATLPARPENQLMARAADKPAPAPAAPPADERVAGGVAGGVVGGVVSGLPDAAPAQKPAAAEADKSFALKEEMQAAPTAKGRVAPAPIELRAAASAPSGAMRADAAGSTALKKATVSGSLTAWRFGEGGVVERTTDGQSWMRQVSGVTTTLVAGWAVSSRVCWIVGLDGVVLKTEDGASWQRVTMPVAEPLVSVFASSARAASVRTAAGQEYVTTDGGVTWRSK